MRNTKEKILSILMLLALMANNLLYPINYVTAQDSGDVEIIETSIEGENLDVELDVPVSDDILDLENPDNVLEENGNDVILSGNNEELTGNDSVLSGDNEELTGNDSVLSGDNEELTGNDSILSGNNEETTGNIEFGENLDELDLIRETLNDTEISGQETYKRVTVNVQAPAGTFPEGVELRISPITTKNEIKEIKEQIVDSQSNIEEELELVAFDIAFLYTLSDGTEVELQPKDGESVQVTFDYSNNKTFKKAEADDNQTIEVYHINDKNENGEKVEKGEETVEKIEINQVASTEVDNGLVINAESFSVYVLVLSDDDTITLTLNPGEGSILSGENITINEETGTGTILSEGGNVILPLAIRENHEFLGWYTAGEIFAGSGGNSYEITGDITLYAKWQEDEGVTYTVTFDANRGTFADTPADQVITGGYYAEEPQTHPELPGYTFTGWYTAAIGGNKWNFANDPVTENITLYAHWIYNEIFGELDVYMIDSNKNLTKIVMMDRNLGASARYDRLDFTSPNFSSLGFAYQWGNNWGFTRCANNTLCHGDGTPNPFTIPYTQKVTDWVGHVPSKYASKYFHGKDDSNYAGGTWISSNNGDDGNNLWGLETGTLEARQGPCPDGYYLPSGDDYNTLYTKWKDIRGYSKLETDDEIRDFTEDFLFPFAGSHKKGRFYEYDQGLCADYWTNSLGAKVNATSANNFWFCRNKSNNYKGVGYSDTQVSPRNNGSTIRCFSDSNNANLTIDAKGGKQALITIIKEGNVSTIDTIKEPVKKTANNIDLVFSGWYTTSDYQDGTKKIEGSTLSASDTTLYARWDCPNGLVYDSGNNQCVSLYNVYTVIFEDWNGDFLWSGKVASGEIPTYNGSTPSRPATEQYIYSFNGWYPEISPVTMDTTYTATYTELPRLYTVTLTGTPTGYGTLTPESLSKEYGAAIVISGDKLTVGGAEVILTGNEGYEFQEWTGTCGKVEKQICDEHIIYSHPDPIEFTGENNLIITNSGYDLFSQSNFQKDFEISFDIVDQDLSGSTSQATVLNVKDEDRSEDEIYPGFTVRKSTTNGKIEVTARGIKGKKIGSKNYNTEDVHSVKISRINSILYVSINGSENEELYDYSGFNNYFTKPIVFGSSYKDLDHLFRPAKVTLSNILVKSVDTCYTGNIYAVTGDCQMTAVFSASGSCPYGGELYENGSVLTGYQSDSVACPNSCVSQVATCNNGEWSVNDFETEYSYSSCTYSGFTCDAGEYPLLGCPENGICSSCTGYTVNENACNQLSPIYKLDSCDEHYHTGLNNDSCEIDTFEITWLDGNGQILTTDIVDYNVVPTYSGLTPTKTSTTQTGYIFNKTWTPTPVVATENATYTAQFDEELRSYVITWLDDDNSVIDTGLVEYGIVPTHASGSKENTAEYTYIFSGWDPELTGVVGDATYKAEYIANKNSYEIKWIYMTETGLQVEEIGSFEYGVVPNHNIPPYYETIETGYTFNRWTPELTGVTGPAIYTAQYNETPRTYTVSFTVSPTGYGILNPSQIIAEYGSQIITEGNTLTVGNETVTATVTGADEQYTYVFVEWTGNCGNTLTHACTITAIFDKILNNYEITWIYMDGNGESVTETGVLPYGSMPNHDNPPYYETNATGYTFSGWNPELTGVVGEQTYTAIYNGLARKYNLTVTSADITRGTVSPTSGLFDYGSTVTLTATAKTGYSFSRWIKVESGVETEISNQSPYEITITGNTEIKAEFGYGQTTYKVKHYKQNVNGNDYESPEIQILTGITNNTTTATAKSYTGFRDPGNIEQKTILADGSTEVEIYYYRDSYNVYWNYMVDGSEGSQDGQSTTSEENYLYGQIPEYKNISGYKTVSKVYTFNGWYDGGYHTYFVGENLPEVTGQVTYTAQYSDVRREYTGIFYDENGEIPLYTGHQSYGETWWYLGEIPTKESTIQYSYNFYGRKDGPYFYSSGNLPTVTSDQNFTAVFDEVVNEYLITFEDEGGNELWRNYFPYGESPVYEGVLPTKEQTISTVYTFNGWRKGDSEFQSGVGLPIVDGTGTYTVIFSEIPRQYEISFVDRDGTGLLDPILYNYGSGVDEIYVPNHPERTDTDEYSYTFMGWDPELTGTVVGDQVYTAVYTEVKRKYEVTFTVSPTGYGILNPLQIIAEYGSPITTSGNELTVGTETVSATPATGNAQYTYEFIGWTGDCEDILTHQCTITALFNRTLNKYEITWKYYGGSDTGMVEYGEMPNHNNPGNYVENNRNYVFSGWRPELVTVTESTGYTAEYTASGCLAGYHDDNGSCVAEKIGECIMPEDVITNATYTTTGAYTWENNQWKAPECEFERCNGGYHQVGQTCVSNEDIVTQCNTGTRPANTVITAGTFVQKWTGTGFLPETKEWTYNGVECGFTCDTNYHRDGSICTSNSGIFPCDGTGTPENATVVMTGVNVSWDPTLNNGSGGWTEPVACEWNCNATYHKLGDTCVSNDDLVVNCDSTTRPANTVITAGIFVQKWTGTGFLPETKEWTYNGAECGFACATNYSRNGSACVNDNGQGGQGNGSSSTNSLHQDTFRRDRCPRGDYSDSYYDGDCGVAPGDSDNHGKTHGSAGDVEIRNDEVREAYEWARTNKIIDKYIDNQDLDGYLTRGNMAKFMVNFVVRLGLIKPTTVPTECTSRNDVDDEWASDDIKNYAILACTFGIMGINMPNNEFRPNDIVSRAEFGTIVSRILWGNRYDIVGDNKSFYYRKHLVALKQRGVMKEIQNPTSRKELIKWVLVVLKRVVDEE